MRPLELRLRDFRSFRGDEQAFDFRGRRLVGIVGPIGAGKSSILDAISFALYAKTASVSTKSASLIHQRAEGSAVSLRFEVEGEVWQAVRAIRKGKSPAQHALYHLESDSDDAAEIEKITGKADVDTKIVELLGLEFDAFRQSVLLAQGRFAEFLQSSTTVRDKVLKGVFGHDRLDAMKIGARARVQLADGELERLSIRAEQVDRVVVRLAENKLALAELTLRIETLEKAEPRIRDIEAQVADATKRVTEATQRLKELQTLARRLPDPDTTDGLLNAAKSASERRTMLGGELTAAQDSLAVVETAQTAADVEAVEQMLREAQRLVDSIVLQDRTVAEARKRQDDAARREATAAASLIETQTRHAAAAVGIKAAQRASERAEEAFQTNERKLHEARHGDMAMTLRSSLVSGEPCPVCMQAVDVNPDIATAPDVAAAQALVDRARSTLHSAEQALTAAVAEQKAADEAVETAQRQLAILAEQNATAGSAVSEAQAAQDQSRTALIAVLGEGEPATLIAERRKSMAALAAAVDKARKQVDQCRQALDDAIVAEQETSKQLSEIQNLLVELSTRLDLDIETTSVDPAEIGAALTRLRTGWGDKTEELRSAESTGGEQTKRGNDELAALSAELGLEDDLASTLARARARADLLATEITLGTKEMDDSEHFIEKRDATAARRDTYARLASDLTDSNFLKYLLDDERARLAGLGSDHFQRLSAGRYRFSDDENFNIVDLAAADAVRGAMSLSGGETFLASLALALSLAEMVTRTGGRLDAFFLDEGFGSLDPEHLDLAMDGIEALVADDADRLVVVVSHVPELRQRLEDLIVLDKDATTGDTRVVRA